MSLRTFPPLSNLLGLVEKGRVCGVGLDEWRFCPTR